jgi:hypothetical protein
MSPGFRLAEKLERHKLGHPLAVVHLFGLFRRLIEFKLPGAMEA